MAYNIYMYLHNILLGFDAWGIAIELTIRQQSATANIDNRCLKGKQCSAQCTRCCDYVYIHSLGGMNVTVGHHLRSL